jgi:hypothetical protein
LTELQRGTWIVFVWFVFVLWVSGIVAHAGSLLAFLGLRGGVTRGQVVTIILAIEAPAIAMLIVAQVAALRIFRRGRRPSLGIVILVVMVAVLGLQLAAQGGLWTVGGQALAMARRVAAL